MNKKELESLAWLYFDGEISESELTQLRRELSASAQNRATYARLHRLHLATVVAVCGRTVDLRQVPPNLLTLLDTEAAHGPDARKIVAFAASCGALAACAALAFVAFDDKTGNSQALPPAVANVSPAAAPAVASVSPTPAPAEVVGRYAPTSPGAKALSESTRNPDLIAGNDTFNMQFNRRQSPAFGARSPDAFGFDMTPVGNDLDASPVASPAILTEEFFNSEENLIGAPPRTDNPSTSTLIIR